jgi:hypothetical protein
VSRLLRSTAMRRAAKHLIAVLIAGCACVDPSFAFQERSFGDASDRPAGIPSARELPGLELKMPESGSGGVGTEIRIPGVGSVGTLPKLDFGLELLYGANELSGGRLDDRSQPSDLQIRATIKHRF